MRRAAVLIVAVCIALLAWLVFGARDVSPRGDHAADPDVAVLAAGTQEVGETQERGRRRASAGTAARSPVVETTGEIDWEVEERLAAERGEVRGRVVAWVEMRSSDGGTREEQRPDPDAVVAIHRGEPELRDDAYSTKVVVSAERVVPRHDGHFAFPVREDERWRIVVTTSDGRSAGAEGIGPQLLGDVDLAMALGPARLRVLDSERQAPIRGAWALVYASDNDRVPIRRVEADAESGELTFTHAPARALVSAPGYGFAEVDRLADVAEDGEVHDVELTLGYDIAGRIVDGEGRPWAETHVRLEDDGPQRACVTDAEGRFAFERAASYEEVWLYVAVAEGQEVPRVLGVGDRNALIVLPRGGDVSGRVVYSDGTPAVHARVAGRAVAEDGSFQWWGDGSEMAQTIVASVFGNPDGFPTAFVTHSKPVRVEMRPGGVRDVRIVLDETQRSYLRLDVKEADGTQIDARVWAATPLLQQVHSANGTYAALGAPPGTSVSLTVSSAGAKFQPVVLDVVTSASPDAPRIPVTLHALEPTVVRLIAADGTEIPRGSWTRFAVEGYGAKLTKDGRIDAGLGAYVRVVVEARGILIDRQVSLPRTAPWELVLHVPSSHTVSGRMLHADGSGLRGIDVVLVPMPHLSNTYPRALTGADGRFSIRDAPSGRAIFIAWLPPGDVMGARRLIEIPETGDLELGDVVAWEDGVLEGRVVVPDGEARDGLVVEVLFAGGTEEESTQTDAEGRFSVRVPGAADAVVSVSRKGRVRGVAAVDLSQRRDVIVRATRVGTVRVRAPARWAERGYDIYLETRAGAGRWAPRSRRGGTKGELLLEEIPAGSWRLVAIPIEGEERRAEATVSPGAETVVDFRE